jgi:hypothetical protein
MDYTRYYYRKLTGFHVIHFKSQQKNNHRLWNPRRYRQIVEEIKQPMFVEQFRPGAENFNLSFDAVKEIPTYVIFRSPVMDSRR